MSLPMEIEVPQQPNAHGSRFHTRFYLKPIERWSDEEGRKVLVDRDYVEITLPGGKDKHHKEVTDKLLDEWRYGNDRMRKPPSPWAIHAYEKWKAGQEVPENGTPLRNWVPASQSPSFIATAQAANVRTVEDLAQLNDEGLKRLGIGGLQWKRQAVEWLNGADQAKSAGRIAQLETERDQLRETVDSLSHTVKALQDQVRALEAGQTPQPVTIAQPVPSVPPFMDLAAEYETKFGKKPHHKMKPETIAQRIQDGTP